MEISTTQDTIQKVLYLRTRGTPFRYYQKSFANSVNEEKKVLSKDLLEHCRHFFDLALLHVLEDITIPVNGATLLNLLRVVEALQGQGINIGNACKKLEVATQTFYKWQKEYGNLNINKAKKQKALESENSPLNKLVADLPLDNAIL